MNLTITFAEAFSDYLIAQRAANRSQTYRNLLAYTQELWQRHKPDCALSQIMPEHIRSFLIWLRQDSPNGGMSSAAADVHFRNLKAFLLWCEREEYLDHGTAPIRRVQRPKVEEKIPDTLEPREVEYILRQVRTSAEPFAWRDYCIHLFFAVTGVRLDELAKLNWPDVNLEDGYAKVLGKGRKERIVSLSPDLCRALVRYKRQYQKAAPGVEAVFTGKRGRRVERGGLRSIIVRDLKQYLKRDICKVGPHTYRRFFVNAMLTKMPIQDVAQLAGHEDLKTTLRYRRRRSVDIVNGLTAHPVDELLRGAR